MTNKLDYKTFVNDNKELLKEFRDKRVIVSYAGGKDASAILHFLIPAKKDFGFEFETHAIMFPTHVYKTDEVHRLDSYWKARGVRIKWHQISVDESPFETAKQNGSNPCEFCHLVKRKFSLQHLDLIVTDWNSLAIIVGWSLWDIVGYSLEYLFGSVYADKEALYQGKSIKERFYRTSQRFYPKLKMKEGYTLYKPLLRYNDQDIIKVIRDNEIPILTTDCKYKDFRPKRLFAECYKKMDLYFNYDKVMQFAQESLILEKPSSYTEIDKEEFITSIF
jgi:tRNA(Ile)-lysidine synthase TilS/MesJ